MTKLRPVFIDENGYTADKQFVVVNRAWLISQTGSLEIDQPPESVFASAEPVLLTDEELEAAREAGERQYMRYRSGIRGQMVMPQDDINYCVARAVEAAVLAKQKGGE